MAMARGWWIDMSNSYNKLEYNHSVNHEYCNRRSTIPGPDTLRALSSSEETNGDGGWNDYNVCAIFNHNTAAGWDCWKWNYTPQYFFAVCIVANKSTAHPVPRLLWVVAAVIILWMTSSHLQLRIWSIISGMDWMIILGLAVQTQQAVC